MKLFSSRTPRDLNHDSHPWAHTACGHEWCDDFGGRFSFNNGTGNVFDPRPEFDHVQHNPPNPVLLDFRRIAYDFWERPWIPDCAADWIRLMGEDPGMNEPGNWGYLAGKTTETERAHALRVLSRLAALEGEKS